MAKATKKTAYTEELDHQIELLEARSKEFGEVLKEESAKLYALTSAGQPRKDTIRRYSNAMDQAAAIRDALAAIKALRAKVA